MSPPAVIRVTTAHIIKGTPQSCSLCPVALAIAEACNISPHGVIAASDVLTVYIGHDIFRAPAPPEVGEFMGAYDNAAPAYVAPFQFTTEWTRSEIEDA